MTINKAQDEIVSTFEFMESWEDKYNYIIDLGKELPIIDEQYKNEKYLIKGCQSQVWLSAELDENNRIVFKADSDAIITKGIIALMIQVFSKQSPKDIANSDVYFIDKIGLKSHLSPTRSNGLFSMLKQIKLYSIALQIRK